MYCRVCCETYKTGFSAMKASVGAKLKLHFINGVTTDHLEKSRDKQRKTLLNKIDKHARSQTHAVSIHIKQQALKSELEEAVQKAHTVWEEVNAEKIDATCKVFCSAYLCAKEELAFTKHSAIMKLQELNGHTKAAMLYSHHSCANILKHVAQEMKAELSSYLKQSMHPFSIMIDETTTLSTKSALIVFIRTQVNDIVCNFFYDLIELSDGSTGVQLANAVLNCFSDLGESTLRRLIGFASDGASVMTGRYEGAVAHLKESLEN